MNNREKYILIRFCFDVNFQDFSKRMAGPSLFDSLHHAGEESNFADEFEWIANQIKQSNTDITAGRYLSDAQAGAATEMLKTRKLKKIKNKVIAPQKIICMRAEYADKHKKSWQNSESHINRYMYCYTYDSIDFDSECSMPSKLSREELFELYYHSYDRKPKLRKYEYMITPCIKSI